jgi:putative addiction module killer protein
MQRILHYTTTDGRDVFQTWLDSLRDQVAKARILVRLNRLAAGNIGDCKPVGDGVHELRIHHGPGYRIYFSYAGRELVVLLNGGDKQQQAADISKAKKYCADFRRRSP